MSCTQPKRQAWLQTGPPTYSPPRKDGETSQKKRAKSCDDDSEGGEEYTLTAFGDVSPEDPYVPLGSKRYNLRPRVRRPPLPGKRYSPTDQYESTYARALADHLRNSQRDDDFTSSAQDFRDFMESVRASRRKAIKRADSVSSSRANSSSPRSSKGSSDFDSYDSPIPATRIRRRLPIPSWDE
ncbi:hypothetical protein EUX98_g8818 [Antrodiella citrinella]|uniref:Uncharacterized protein n=1 Tax=Antrodiella citrinella TaxID=2447956 RepID=A0A4S4M295_9APHY|nr:hypothetical protein EUX98_g8818 [Antrodiella citrinella]